MCEGETRAGLRAACVALPELLAVTVCTVAEQECGREEMAIRMSVMVWW